MSAADGKAVNDKMAKLGLDLRQGPIYQFFRECGPVTAYAVIQSQMEVANCHLKVVGVFLFEDEANAAKKYMEENKKQSILTFSVQPTKITRMKGY